MSKKKRNKSSSAVRNTVPVCVEIDYEKLAEAVLKASEIQAGQTEDKCSRKPKIYVVAILIAVVTGLVGAFFIVYLIYSLITEAFLIGDYRTVEVFVAGSFLIVLSLILVCAADMEDSGSMIAVAALAMSVISTMLSVLFCN